MRAFAETFVIANLPIGRRVLYQRADDAVAELECRSISQHHAYPARVGTRLQDRDRLGVAGFVHQKGCALPLTTDAQRHGHGFRCRGALVQERCVGNLQAREVRHRRLEVEQRLEPPLRYLRLVRSVRGIPTRILQDVAENDRRGNAIRISHSDVGPEDRVAIRHFSQHRENGLLWLCVG